MELQLALALPSNPIKGFDLNSYGYEPKEMVGSDRLNHQDLYNMKSKRSFDEAFEQKNVDLPLTLPLLFWDNPPNQEDDPKGFEKNCFFINKYDGDENGVIGWPPIKTWRKKLCYQSHGGRAASDMTVESVGGGGGLKSTYVKVKMEGVAIARKVDLSLYDSYQTLTDTLVDMFGITQKNVKAYKLTYQDREGDWLLAGDVPWGTFIWAVQRLKLIKNGG